MVPNFLTSIYTSISSQLNPIDDFKTDMSNEICFNFIRDFGETENQINKDQLERNIMSYPKDMGTSLRALRDETEYAKGICDSDGVYTDLENTIKKLDEFVDDYLSPLVGLKDKHELISTTSRDESHSDSSQNGKILNMAIDILIPIMMVYSYSETHKINKIYNAFESAYGEK